MLTLGTSSASTEASSLGDMVANVERGLLDERLKKREEWFRLKDTLCVSTTGPNYEPVDENHAQIWPVVDRPSFQVGEGMYVRMYVCMVLLH